MLGQWFQSQSLVPLHDPILEGYARKLASQGSEEAVVWAERILDDDLRLHCFESVALLWYQREPETALAWLESSSLDEEVRKAAREAIRNAPDRRRPGKKPLRPPSQGSK